MLGAVIGYDATTRDAFRAPHTELRALRSTIEVKSTIEDQRYVLSKRVDRATIRSVVVWNKPSRVAYAAAALRR